MKGTSYITNDTRATNQISIIPRIHDITLSKAKSISGG
jgi:hypothetical protein